MFRKNKEKDKRLRDLEELVCAEQKELSKFSEELNKMYELLLAFEKGLVQLDKGFKCLTDDLGLLESYPERQVIKYNV